jgi:WD40 repeat protein
LKAPRVVYKGHRLTVTCVGMLQSPNRERSIIFTGSEDKNVIAWSLQSGEKIAELRGHTQRVTSIATFSTPGYEPLVVSAGWDERVRIWPVSECFPSTNSGEQTVPEVKPEDSALQSPSLSDRISGNSIVLRGHRNRIFGVAVMHPVGEEPCVASGSSDNTIRVWSLPAGELMYVLEDEQDDTWNLCLSTWFISLKHFHEAKYHGNVILSGCKNNTVRVWKHRTPSIVEAMRKADAAALAASTMSGLRQLGVTRKKERTEPNLVIRGHKSAVHSLAPFDYQGQPFVVTACKDCDVRIFSLLTGT